MQKPKRKKGVEEPMEVDERPSENGALSDQGCVLNGDTDHISDDEEGGVRVGDIYIPPAPKPALTFDANGPRMLITHIVNENFKSYAGKQALGPFHKSFTAIIGPNGSGKSNVIDSMLFVFGYRASKIRSKKISVLIHSSSKHPNISSATVAVHFCQIIDGDGDEFTVVPNSEIVVSRTAFKDNSSYYTLNGRRVQFKEVAKVLRSHGIDLDHNRFLILQGEVEQIAMMKPRGWTEHESGMLEYLEDIVGTARYKVPIDQLYSKSEELTDMRKEKLNRVRLVEQEKSRLEQPMREAMEKIELTNVVTRTRNTLLQKYIYETGKIAVVKEKNLEDMKSNLTGIDEKLQQIKEQLTEKTAVLKEGTQRYDVLEKEKDVISEKLHGWKNRMVTVQSDTNVAKKKKKNLEQLLETEKRKLLDLELAPEKNSREIEECEKLLVKHNESKAKAEGELQTAMAAVRTKTQGLQEQKDKLQAKLMELKKIVDAATKRFKLAESELKIYTSTETVETEKLQRMEEAYEKAAKDLEEKTAQHAELQSSVPTFEQQLQEQQARVAQVRQEEGTVVAETRGMRAQLEESRQALQATRSRGRVLDGLMTEQRNGGLSGVFGRLGDLGGIDSKYDVAISTCCNALDNIVVDTVETAQACVEYLRSNDVGRATFIALDKQEHLKKQYERRTKFPQGVPRLFDLVTVKDPRVLPAFYFALRDTLVATDLEQATKIAYGATRYRVVTLNGDVIEIAGTMSGGGKSTSRGRMGRAVQEDTRRNSRSSLDPQNITAIEKKLQRNEQRVSSLRSELSSLEEAVVSTQRNAREGKSMLHKLHVEIRSLKEQVPILKSQIKQQQSKVSASRVDPEQQTRLQEEVDAARAELDTASRNAGKVEKEVAGVDDQINTVAGKKVKELQKLVKELGKKIDMVNTEINKLRVNSLSSVRHAGNSKKTITQMTGDLTETEKTLESLSAEKKQLTIDIAEYTRQLEQLEEQISEGTNEFSGLKQEIAKLQAKENKVKGARIEACNAVSKAEKAAAECKARIPTWEREVAELTLEDPGFEIPGVDRPEPLVTHTPEELEEFEVEELRNRVQAQRARVGDEPPNIQAILDYRAKEELYLKRAAELDEITTKRNDMRALHDQLKKKRTTDFLAGFNTITAKLKEMYQMITLGGDAELELVDSLDPFTEGIQFSVRPPNKSWKNISNLSGGEKTLSSLALVFALHYYKPTPLYVMDEIDAALDFKNVSIVANYIKERTKNAQFIIISLRYNMFEVSNRLVGIYKTEDCTKSITIENKIPDPLPQILEREVEPMGA